MEPTVNPLTQTHCNCLTDVIESSAKLAALIKDCQDCGLDYTIQASENAAQSKVATALKAKFFPGVP